MTILLNDNPEAIRGMEPGTIVGVRHPDTGEIVLMKYHRCYMDAYFTTLDSQVDEYKRLREIAEQDDESSFDNWPKYGDYIKHLRPIPGTTALCEGYIFEAALKTGQYVIA